MTRRSAYTEDTFTIARVFDERVNLTPNKTAYCEYDHRAQDWRSYTWTETRA